MKLLGLFLYVSADLLTPANYERVVEHRLENRKRTFHFRNLTYIPEISDKKHRISYNYLSAGKYFDKAVLVMRGTSNCENRSIKFNPLLNLSPLPPQKKK
jgi:hypothetical protein